MALFKKTVDGILADIQSKIDQLQALAEKESQAALELRAQAMVMHAQANDSEAEANRALRISAKIEELVA